MKVVDKSLLLLRVDISTITLEGDGLRYSRITKRCELLFIAMTKTSLLPRRVAVCSYRLTATHDILHGERGAAYRTIVAGLKASILEEIVSTMPDTPDGHA